MRKLFIFFLAIIMAGCNYKSEKEELLSEIESLNSEKSRLIERNDQLHTKIDSILQINEELRRELNFWYNNNVHGRELLNDGIENPEEFIINSLKRKPELIPTEGVLGGKMQFVKVLLLGKNHLIAYYEDGHIAGKAIYYFEYKNGKVEFDMLIAYMD